MPMPGAPGPIGPGPAGPPGAAPRTAPRTGMGAILVARRTELRRRMREQQRLRMLTLMAAVVVVLGALPLYLLIHAARQDPVFASLNSLQVPAWATGTAQDQVAGSRWCVMECRFRERDMPSQKPADETNVAYVKALEDAGWVRWKPHTGCPLEPVDGHYSCWRRDEYTLDLWVRSKPCSDGSLPAQPSAAPDAAGAKADCSGSMVSFKVYNAIADERLTQPDQSPPAPDLSP
jgi:hypothetical protein